MGDRTAAEREAARLERERRRAERAGRPAPAPAAPPEDRELESPGPTTNRAPRAQEPAHDPQLTQVFDVTTTWTGEHAAVAAPAAPAPAPPVEPEPVESAPAPAPPVEPEPPAPASPPAPAADDPDVPLGTRRVARGERPALAQRRRVPKPPKPPRARRPKPTAGGPRRWRGRVAALLALVAFALAAWFLWSIYQPGKGDGSGQVVVQVPRGASVGEIGDLLSGRGVIDSSFFFRLRAKLSGAGGDLKSGTFTLRRDMSYGAALDALSHNPPPPPVVRVTIPEGESRGEIAVRARQAGLHGSYSAASRAARALDPHAYGAPKGATLEGFLFPATYELRQGATAQQLVNQQLLAFRQNLATLNLRFARSKNLTVFDVVTIASMVEREVMVARERPLVAAVIYNRLKQGMPLGIDATLRYALNDWTRPLTVSELQSSTPYNTRTHAGLPPGPIGNPGLASLEAAAHPAKVPYLFYVVKPGTCGQHAFSSTDAQFQRDVQRYNQARDAAGGKSPTKC
ncbi:MAG: endolytic transglycosylase MltG [Actinobacteria bacterium]|nr:endolytic transglycosylase MltG [Actinomycetota bacterium]